MIVGIIVNKKDKLLVEVRKDIFNHLHIQVQVLYKLNSLHGWGRRIENIDENKLYYNQIWGAVKNQKAMNNNRGRMSRYSDWKENSLE